MQQKGSQNLKTATKIIDFVIPPETFSGTVLRSSKMQKPGCHYAQNYDLIS